MYVFIAVSERVIGTVYKSEIREHIEYNTGSMRFYSKMFYHLIAMKCLRIDILDFFLKKTRINTYSLAIETADIVN